jgi:hypothetical protein
MNFEQYVNKHINTPYVPNIISENNNFRPSISETLISANGDDWLISRTRK